MLSSSHAGQIVFTSTDKVVFTRGEHWSILKPLNFTVENAFDFCFVQTTNKASVQIVNLLKCTIQLSFINKI